MKIGSKAKPAGKKASTKKKSIRARIMSRMSLTVLISLLVVTIVNTVLSTINTMNILEATLAETAVLAADRVEEEMIAYGNIAREVGLNSDLSNRSVSLDRKLSIVDTRVNIHSFERAFILDEKGVDISTGEDHSAQAYFTRAKGGETYVSEPVIKPETSEIVNVVSAPIWSGGMPGSTVTGVVCFVPSSTYLNDIVSSIQVSENGGAYILNAEGTTIACEDMEVVLRQENVVRDFSDDPELAQLAVLEADMAAGNSGFGTYIYEGHTELMAYAPIPGTDGWSIAITTYMTDFTNTLITCTVLSVLLTVLAILVSIFLARQLANGIGKPLQACAERLDTLAEGDLHSPVPVAKTEDEIGTLLSASARLQNDLQSIIHDFSFIMAELSRGNFTVDSSDASIYKADYQEMLQSMRALCANMGDTLRRIDDTSTQVDMGAGQVAAGAQALSQGSVEQAASVEQLAASLNQINEHIRTSGEYINQADQKTEHAGRMADQCNRQMQEMVAAMDDINRSSEEIGKIIKTIEDIAFQTNILALNAAVEAARAGSAGKGFAVVADEVRNLAAKSAEASQSTAALIENSIAAVHRGTKLANDTAEQLQLVADSNQVIAEMVRKIALSSAEQTEGINQVSIGVEQISTVVQTNSATAEQSAAASEEMAGQAAMLKQLVDQFQLDR